MDSDDKQYIASLHDEEEIASHLEELEKNPHSKVWQSFIDNQIIHLRDDVELNQTKFDEKELRYRLAKLEVLRSNFVDMFPLWRERGRQVRREIKDSQVDEPDGPIV